MATKAALPAPRGSLALGITDYVLAAGSAAMLAAMAAELVRGQPEWHLVHWPLWAHLATLVVALMLTPVMVLRARGDRLHRRLGYAWLAAMVATALVSFLIPPPGAFSPIFLLSALTLFLCWRILANARRHDWQQHRANVHGLTIGALIIAGFFTFLFGRIFDRWIGGLT